MSTPNEPQNPFEKGSEPESGAPGYPAAPPPAAGGYPAAPPPPQSGYPAAPQYPSAPQYGGAPAYGGTQAYGTPYPKNSLGVWALVLGIVSFVLSCGLFTGIPAIIVGNNAKKAVQRGEANNGGLATAGVVLGWVATVLSILGIIVTIIVFSNAEFRDAFVDGYNSSSY